MSSFGVARHAGIGHAELLLDVAYVQPHLCVRHTNMSHTFNKDSLPRLS